MSERLIHWREMLHHLPTELPVAAVLSAAGMLSSWAGYEASLWDGVQFLQYSNSSTSRLAAETALLDANLTRSTEVGVFRNWVEARLKGDVRLAAFYQDRFPKDLDKAFPEWLAQRPFDNPRAPPSPFSLASYRPQGEIDAAAMNARADRELAAAMDAKHTADSYGRAAVILATAMFFAGIGQAFRQARIRLGLIVGAAVILALGIVQLFSLPVMFLGRH